MAQGRPDFIGIGAQKAATTWLFKRLCMHPEIYFPRGKEMHFWDRRDSHCIALKNYEKAFSGFQITHIGGKTGEITPAYLLVSDARIRELVKMAPDLRLLLLLRNPVERAISAAAQIERQHGPDHTRQNPLFSRNTTEGGLYGKHLKRWLAHFPMEQILILTQDEVKADPRTVLKRTATHIGVDPAVYDMIDLSLLSATTSPSPNRREVPPRQIMRLREIYREDIEILEHLLDRRFGWLPEDSAQEDVADEPT